MAGKPTHRALMAELAKQSKESGVPPEEIVLARVESGETLIEIAASLSRTAGTRIPRTTLSYWLNKTPARKQRLQEARKASAPALVEQAVEILDDVDHDRDAIAKAKARADLRTWMASKYDRQTFGNDAAQVNVQVSLGDMHLDALRRRSVPVLASPAPRALTDGPDYEVLPE